jgi:hypothetical protein
MAIVEESEYKGNPMIVLRRTAEDRYPFQFGLSKAKLMVEAFEEIKKWVEKQEKNKPSSGPGGED